MAAKIKLYMQLKPEYAKRYLAHYKSLEGVEKHRKEWERVFDPKYYDFFVEEAEA